MTNAEAWFNNSLCPWKPEGLLGRTAQDGHLDSHIAPELNNVLHINYRKTKTSSFNSYLSSLLYIHCLFVWWEVGVFFGCYCQGILHHRSSRY